MAFRIHTSDMRNYHVRARHADHLDQPPNSTTLDRAVSESGSGMADHSRAQRSTYKSTPATEWLYKHTTASKATHRSFLENSDHDGFLALGLAMKTRGDPIQECMFNKFYLFLHDNLPNGLTGKLAHILGDDVMGYLLCCSETAPSRHKLTKQAEAAFTKLQAWMAGGRNWREAQEAAASSVSADQEKQKRTGGRKRQSDLAPGLHSPAGMTQLSQYLRPSS